MRTISTITGIKNRFKTLRANIGSWLNFDEITEIVIVDWDSNDIGPAEQKYLRELDPRIRYHRVAPKPIYHIAGALNTAAKISTGEWLMRLDVDYALNPYYNLFQAYQPEPHEFFTGDWTQKYLDNGYGFIEQLNGFLYVSREAFQMAGGYDTRMTDYGWEDDNFYLRLIDAGYERRVIDASQRLIYHTPHDDTVRMANFRAKNRDESWKKNWEISGKPPVKQQTVVTPPAQPVVSTIGQPSTPPKSAIGRIPKRFTPKT